MLTVRNVFEIIGFRIGSVKNTGQVSLIKMLLYWTACLCLHMTMVSRWYDIINSNATVKIKGIESIVMGER